MIIVAIIATLVALTLLACALLFVLLCAPSRDGVSVDDAAVEAARRSILLNETLIELEANRDAILRGFDEDVRRARSD